MKVAEDPEVDVEKLDTELFDSLFLLMMNKNRASSNMQKFASPWR